MGSPHQPLFWLDRLSLSKAPLLSPQEIRRFNQDLTQISAARCTDMFCFPATLPGKILEAEIRSLWPTPEEVPLSIHMDAALQAACNLTALPSTVRIQPGVATAPASLRVFPSPLSSYALTLLDGDFDLLALSSVKLWEPLLIFHTDPSARWIFVRTPTASGWMERQCAALCRKEDWPSSNFLLVAGDVLRLDGLQPLSMATRLPIDGGRNFQVPQQDENGRLSRKTISSSQKTSLHPGFLPFTQENIFRQAFRLLGRPYRWSGLWDCSAFVQDVFACFGFVLPRNTGEQVYIPCQTIDFTSINKAGRLELLCSLPPGALLYMKGHVMLYLGLANGRPMVIHALWQAKSPTGQLLHYGRTAITSLELFRANGQTFLEGLTAAKILWEPSVISTGYKHR